MKKYKCKYNFLVRDIGYPPPYNFSVRDVDYSPDRYNTVMENSIWIMKEKTDDEVVLIPSEETICDDKEYHFDFNLLLDIDKFNKCFEEIK